MLTDYIAEHEIVYSGNEQFRISVHSGIASGIIQRDIIDYGSRFAYMYSGDVMNSAAILLDKAGRGQIAMDKSTADCGCSYREHNDCLIFEGIDNDIDDKTKHVSGMIRDDTERFIDPQIADMKNDVLLNSHRHITVVFITMHANGQWHERISMLEQYLSLIDRFNAYHDKFDFAHKGIKSMIILGAPNAMLDRELKALYLVNSIKALFENNNVNYHIGIHSGHAFCGILGNDKRTEYTVMGDTINTAARIMSSAPRNTILISSNVYKSVRKHISLQNSESLMLRGKQQVSEVYSFDGNIMPRMDDYWTEHAFIGRQGEIRTAMNMIEKSINGDVNGICITGQSGSGKTMFIKQILKLVNGRSAPLIIKCREFNSNTPFSALWDIMTAISGTAVNWYEQIPEQIMSSIPGKSVQAIKSYFADTCKKSKDDNVLLFNALSDIMNQYFSQYPLLVVVDDCQWLDESTWGFIDFYREDMSRKSKTILISTAEKLNSSRYAPIELNPFDKNEVSALIQERYDSEEIARQLTGILHTNSEGSPLIINEILHMIEENKGIEILNGKYTIHIDRIDAFINRNTESYIASFLDFLPSDIRHAVSVLAVFGDRMTVNEYREITRIKGFNENALPMRHIEFENGYLSFRNHITRRTVYNSLPYSFKEDIHYTIIQLTDKGVIKRNSEFMISHLINSGQYSRALPLCISAGENNKDICSYRSALHYYDKALTCLEHVPEPSEELLKLFRKDI